MEPSELLRYVAAVLERLDLRYLVTGSMATILYGEPRFTNDIDVAVMLPAKRVPEFCQAFPATDFDVGRRAVDDSDVGLESYAPMPPVLFCWVFPCPTSRTVHNGIDGTTTA